MDYFILEDIYRKINVNTFSKLLKNSKTHNWMGCPLSDHQNNSEVIHFWFIRFILFRQARLHFRSWPISQKTYLAFYTGDISQRRGLTLSCNETNHNLLYIRIYKICKYIVKIYVHIVKYNCTYYAVRYTWAQLGHGIPQWIQVCLESRCLGLIRTFVQLLIAIFSPSYQLLTFLFFLSFFASPSP